MYRRSPFTLALSVCITAACATADVDVSSSVSGSQTVQLPNALGGGQGVTVPGSTGPATPHGYGAIYTPPPASDDGAQVLSASPPSADISDEAPPVGDQGQTGSCTTWSTAHSALGWWANHSGHPGATFAPMYLYSQIVKGNCSNGSTVDAVLAMLQQHGVDTQTDYEPIRSRPRLRDAADQRTEDQRRDASRSAATSRATWPAARRRPSRRRSQRADPRS